MQCIIDFEVDDLLWVAASKKPERCVVYYNWNGHRNSLEAGKIEDEDEGVRQLMSSVLQIMNSYIGQPEYKVVQEGDVPKVHRVLCDAGTNEEVEADVSNAACYLGKVC